MDPNRLTGKNILITGAARGMGAANAESFAAQGANVCLGDLDLGEAQQVADKINAAGVGKAIAVKMDVTKREDNVSAVAATVAADVAALGTSYCQTFRHQSARHNQGAPICYRVGVWPFRH